MQQFIDSYLGTLRGQFYICQVITILLLLVYGLVFMAIIRGKSISVFDYILVYPLALVIYSVSGYFLLSAGIVFNRYSVIAMMMLILIALGFVFRSNIYAACRNKSSLIFLGIMAVLTLISVSGVIPVSATNDSMYFFSEYPRALVRYGSLTSILDNFLTDASQGIAIIGTLPFFYGFDEIYGVQTLLNINFYAFFAYTVYDYADGIIEKKQTYAVSALAVLMLLTSMPFVLMSRWFMANSYFMEYMAILIYTAYRFSRNDEENVSDILVISLLVTGISIMRMEGALNAGVLILCIMMLGYKNKDIILGFICPVLILQAMYLYRIFHILTLHTKIQFMTKGKAVILMMFLVCIILYVLIIRDRFFVGLKKYYPYLIMGGVLLVNLAVFIYDRSNYIINLKAYIGNVLRSSGWGLFVSFVIGVLILVPKKSMKINYFDVTVVSYILLTIITGWARGDALYQSFGDSGNRIMIQAVPIILFALLVKIIEGLSYWKKESSE